MNEIYEVVSAYDRRYFADKYEAEFWCKQCPEYRIAPIQFPKDRRELARLLQSVEDRNNSAYR